MTPQEYEDTHAYWTRELSHAVKPGDRLYRFPTSVYWGINYADGFRHIWAPDAPHALRNVQTVASQTQLRHLQILTKTGWRFVTEEQ